MLKTKSDPVPRDNACSLPDPRHANQDSLLCSQDAGVAVVCDGMGGAAGGSRASGAAVAAALSLLGELPDPDDAAGRGAWIHQARLAAQRVIEEDRARYDGSSVFAPDYSQQDTTWTIAALTDTGTQVAWAGDSRIYRIVADDAYRLELVSTDDDILAMAHGRPEVIAEMRRLLDSVDTAEELYAVEMLPQVYRQRNILGATLMWTDRGVEQHRLSLDLAPGDMLLLCTDGVHDNLTFNELQAVVAAEGDAGPARVAETLVYTARQRSMDEDHLRSKLDDISAAVLRFGSAQ